MSYGVGHRHLRIGACWRLSKHPPPCVTVPNCVALDKKGVIRAQVGIQEMFGTVEPAFSDGVLLTAFPLVALLNLVFLGQMVRSYVRTPEKLGTRVLLLSHSKSSKLTRINRIPMTFY